MAVAVARAPVVVAGLITTRRSARSDGESRNPGPAQYVASANESRRVTAYLRRCPLFAVHLHSNVTELRGKCGSLVNLSGAKDILFNQRSSSALQAGADKLADAVGITVCPRGNIASCILERGPSQFMNPETLRWTHVIHRPERGSSVRTNAGRNKKWRTLDKGRLEGNKRTRSNGNANPGKSKPPTTPGPGFNEDGTERPAKEPRVKPKKGPKPKERVSWAGQDMLLLNAGDRSKVGNEVEPWASVRTERMSDDYYKYGPFGPHAWKGVCVGTPRKGTLCDKLVVFFSTVENEEEHELGDIQDAITGYAKRVDQMDDENVQYYFAFVRQIVKVPGQSPWEEWALVAQVAVESEAELEKESLGSKLDRRMWELLTRCVAWYRPDLIYVKRPAYQVRFEPQKEFLEGWLTLLDPGNHHGDSYYQTLCKLLGVDENENAEQVATIFDGFSEEKKMECVEHVLTSHPVCLLTPFIAQSLKVKPVNGMSTTPTESFDRENEIDSVEDAGDYSDTNEDEDFEPDMEAFNAQFGEEFDFDEQDDRSEWEREALAAEAMQESPDAQTLHADDEYWNAQALKVEETVEETETEQLEPFLDAALRPFTYTNLIKEIFIVRRALMELAELRSSM